MEPQPKILSDEQTKQLCGGLSRRQRMRLVPEGKFPAPVKLTPGRIGWVESEILEWNATRIAERDRGTKPMNGTPSETSPVSKVVAALDALENKLRKRVDALGLTARARNALAVDGVGDVGDLVRRTEADLLQVPNLGRVSVAEIKAKLKKLGLNLGMVISEPEPPRSPVRR
jgi:DNA-directed RNA polymerase alpha subunit